MRRFGQGHGEKKRDREQEIEKKNRPSLKLKQVTNY
jgi:hypothetical protein